MCMEYLRRLISKFRSKISVVFDSKKIHEYFEKLRKKRAFDAAQSMVKDSRKNGVYKIEIDQEQNMIFYTRKHVCKYVGIKRFRKDKPTLETSYYTFFIQALDIICGDHNTCQRDDTVVMYWIF